MTDAHEEAERWSRGDQEAEHYQDFLDQSAENPLGQSGNGTLNKVLKPEDMPWERSPQGLVKHMLNEQIEEKYDYPGKGADMYMQMIPPGSRSGKHRHMGEEIVIILEGSGYDLHWDAELELGVEMNYDFADEAKRFEWEAGDAVYIPANTIHQHFNDDEDEPARFISAQARAYTNLGFGYEDLEQYETTPEYEEDDE